MQESHLFVHHPSHNPESMSYQTSHYEYTKKGVAGKVDLLPSDYEPGEWDVICQRGKECYEHEGNRRFHTAIERHSADYFRVKSRKGKSAYVSDIVASVCAASKATSSIGGGFVRKELLSRRWYRVSDKVAREKAGQALRDINKTQNKASEKKRSRELAESSCSDQASFSHDPSSSSNQEDEFFSRAGKRPRPSADCVTSNFGGNLQSFSPRSLPTYIDPLPLQRPIDQDSFFEPSSLEHNLFVLESPRSICDYLDPSPLDQNHRFDFKLVASDLEPTPIIVTKATHQHGHGSRSPNQNAEESGIEFFRSLYKADASFRVLIDEHKMPQFPPALIIA